MIATRIGHTERYVLKCDRHLPESEQTVFVLKVLTADGRAAVTDALVGTDEDSNPVARPGTGLLAACRRGIDSVERLRDSSGEEVAVKHTLDVTTRVVTREGLDLIASAISEVGTRVLKLNRLDEDGDDKDSAGNASTSSPTSPPDERPATTTESSEAVEPAQPVTVGQ